MSGHECIVVGSGINSLVCAALLAKKGRHVRVLERNARLGGCIVTDTKSFPGFTLDLCSQWYPLFVTSPAYAALAPELHARGVEFLNTDAPAAVLTPDGGSFVLRTSREANVQNMEARAPGDGEAYARAMGELERSAALTFALLGSEPWSGAALRACLAYAWRNGPHGLAAYFGSALQRCRARLNADFKSDIVRACIAPWVLHAGLGPDDLLSAQMARLICFTLEQAGCPVVKGGSVRIVEAFVDIIRANGGECLTGVDVERVLTHEGRARGVRAADGTEFSADAVICNVTPTQLYGRLLEGGPVPDAVRGEARDYLYGRAAMQIHLVLDRPPGWADAALSRAGIIHLSAGADAVSRAVNEAERGLLPAEGTIALGQPAALDASRVPAGKGLLWLQLLELPRIIRGDAAGKIPTPADGRWNDAVRDAYAARVIARVCRHLPELESSISGRIVLGPHDLERMNVNLVGGDPYSGASSLEQYMLWRPLRSTRNHATPVRNLYHIGASTHPGPGLGGVSGFQVARQL